MKMNAFKKNKLAPRKKAAEKMMSALNNDSIRLLHLYGISGSGKSTLIREHLPKSYSFICKFVCQKKDLDDPDEIITKLATSTLNSNLLKKWRKERQQRLSKELLLNIKQKKYYKLIIEAPIVADEIIVGDKITKTEKEHRKEMIVRARIGFEEFIKLWKANNPQKVILIFDNLENVNLKQENVNWLCSTFLNESKLNLTIVTVGRTKKSLLCPRECSEMIEIGPIETNEADNFLTDAGIDSKVYRNLLINFTRRHALSLHLAAQLPKELDLTKIQIKKVRNKLYEELVADFLVEKIIQSEPNQVYHKALKYIPIFRCFSANSIIHLLQITPEQSAKIIIYLENRRFIERIGDLYKYHDLLRPLTIEYIIRYEGVTEYKKLHKLAADFFINNKAPKGQELFYSVEPFYHLFQRNPSTALKYFESKCKYALDRSDRILSSALLNEIDFDSMNDNPLKGWYLLRYGGFFREFRSYEKAIKVFNNILSMANGDKKLVAYTYNNIGWCYLFHHPKKNAKNAITYFNKSNEICHKLGLLDISAMNYNNIGIAVSRLKNSKKEELTFYQKSLDITESEKNKSPLVAAMTFKNIGLVYAKEKDYERAIGYYLISYEKYHLAKSTHGQAEVAYSSAILYEELGNYKEAKKLLDFSLYSLEKHFDPYYLSEIYFALARVLHKLNDNDNMALCLYQMCGVSLYESWEHHNLNVTRLICYSKYLFAHLGKDFAKNILEKVGFLWKTNKNTSNIRGFTDLLDKTLEEFEKAKYWTHRKSKVIHNFKSKNCPPRSWWKILLLSNHNDISIFSKCKKCFSSG